MKAKKANHIEPQGTILSRIKKENTLIVPDGYFKELPKQLLALSEVEESKTTRVVVTFLYATVAIAAILVLALFVLKPSNKLSPEIALYNDTFKNLTAEGFSEELLLEEDYLIAEVNFDDAEVLSFLKEEMQKPHLEIEVTASDFEEYFELEEDY